MEEQKLGIKETKEALVGVNELSVALIQQFKDGFQPVADVSELYAKLAANPEVSSKLMAAYQDIGKVPAEVKDLDLAEGLELAAVQIAYVPKLVEALKKA